MTSSSPTSSCAPTFNPVGRSLSALVSRNFRSSIHMLCYRCAYIQLCIPFWTVYLGSIGGGIKVKVITSCKAQGSPSPLSGDWRFLLSRLKVSTRTCVGTRMGPRHSLPWPPLDVSYWFRNVNLNLNQERKPKSALSRSSLYCPSEARRNTNGTSVILMCTIVGFEQLFIVTCRYVWTFSAWSKRLQINLFKVQTIIRLGAMKVIYC